MKNHTTISLPVVPVLGLLFLTLKLCGVIAWPWIYVLMPFWLPVAIGLLILVSGLMFMAAVACLK